MTQNIATFGPSTIAPRAARIAFWVLVAITVFFTVVHLVGIFFIADGNDERLMFTTYLALNVLSLVVLFGPFRRAEPWAWAASWIQVATNALVLLILGKGGPGLPYLAFAAVMAVCLLLARPASRS